jgi:hypothetical protein
MLVGEGRVGARTPACHLACCPAVPPTLQLASMHSFMHERMVDGRKACRVGLPLPCVKGLADEGVDVRLALDQQGFHGRSPQLPKGEGLMCEPSRV